MAGKVVVMSGGGVGGRQQKAMSQLAEAKVVPASGQDHGYSDQRQSHNIMANNRWFAATADVIVAKIAAMTELLAEAGKVLAAALVAHAVMVNVMRGKFVAMAVVRATVKVAAGSGKYPCPQGWRLATRSWNCQHHGI